VVINTGGIGGRPTCRLRSLISYIKWCKNAPIGLRFILAQNQKLLREGESTALSPDPFLVVKETPPHTPPLKCPYYLRQWP